MATVHSDWWQGTQASSHLWMGRRLFREAGRALRVWRLLWVDLDLFGAGYELAIWWYFFWGRGMVQGYSRIIGSTWHSCGEGWAVDVLEMNLLTTLAVDFDGFDWRRHLEHDLQIRYWYKTPFNNEDLRLHLYPSSATKQAVAFWFLISFSSTDKRSMISTEVLISHNYNTCAPPALLITFLFQYASKVSKRSSFRMWRRSAGPCRLKSSVRGWSGASVFSLPRGLRWAFLLRFWCAFEAGC